MSKTMNDAFEMVLVNVTEEEAEAVRKAHGSSPCSVCGEEPVGAVLLRLPGEYAFGQNIRGFCACQKHLDEYMAEMSRIPEPGIEEE